MNQLFTTAARIARPNGSNAALPPLPFWQARSFWLFALGLAMPLMQRYGLDPLALMGVETVEDGAQTLAGLAITLAPFIAAAGQRLAPNHRLTLR